MDDENYARLLVRNIGHEAYSNLSPEKKVALDAAIRQLTKYRSGSSENDKAHITSATLAMCAAAKKFDVCPIEYTKSFTTKLASHEKGIQYVLSYVGLKTAPQNEALIRNYVFKHGTETWHDNLKYVKAELAKVEKEIKRARAISVQYTGEPETNIQDEFWDRQRGRIWEYGPEHAFERIQNITGPYYNSIGGEAFIAATTALNAAKRHQEKTAPRHIKVKKEFNSEAPASVIDKMHILADIRSKELENQQALKTNINACKIRIDDRELRAIELGEEDLEIQAGIQDIADNVLILAEEREHLIQGLLAIKNHGLKETDPDYTIAKDSHAEEIASIRQKHGNGGNFVTKEPPQAPQIKAEIISNDDISTYLNDSDQETAALAQSIAALRKEAAPLQDQLATLMAHEELLDAHNLAMAIQNDEGRAYAKIIDKLLGKLNVEHGHLQQDFEDARRNRAAKPALIPGMA